jgi:histidinol dehydrogenase
MKTLSADEFLKKVSKPRQDDLEQYERTVKSIIDYVRKNGDKALFELTAKFDCKGSVPSSIELGPDDYSQAFSNADETLINALGKAHSRIEDFHKRQLSKIQAGSLAYSDGQGSNLGLEMLPMNRVGVYVPGGLASYPSSVLMGVIPAKVAGVREIIVCTPPGPDGRVSTSLLVAARLAGATRVYRVGGAQAIAAMAYGTETIPRVDKIVGPGNSYVTTAKKLVFGHVDIDSLAGPSEVAILADEDANPLFVAADLLSQAEHDPTAWAVLITWSSHLIEKVLREIKCRLEEIPRRLIAAEALKNHGFIVHVKDFEEALAVANAFAPEHVQVMVGQIEEKKEASLSFLRDLVKRLPNCGTLFCGSYSPVAIGDYGAGPNHILPTGGSARAFSGLTVLDFTRTVTFISTSRKGLQSMSDFMLRLAGEEGLFAHAQSVAVRVE